MPDDSLRPIVETAVQVLHEIQAEHACVPAAAILLKVLERLNYPGVYALSVRTEILNDAMHKYIEKHGRPAHDETNEELTSTGAMGRGIGNPPGDQWAGHMGIVVLKHRGNQHAFLDLTIGQASVPLRGIALGPMCLYVDDDFVTGKKPFIAKYNDCHLTYTAYPEDHNYDNGSNWMRMPHLDDYVAMVIERL